MAAAAHGEPAVPAPPSAPMVEHDCARSWLQLEDEDEGHWVRIHEHDEARIDSALSSGELSAAVFGGRWAAVLEDATQGEVRPRYETHLQPKQLRRCNWCFRSWPSNTEWRPFTASDDEVCTEE